jgi:small-conductance mechanosensitive channel
MIELLSSVYYGNRLSDWLLALAAFLVTFTVLPLLRGLVMAQRHRLQQEAGSRPGVELALRLLARTRPLFLWALALYAFERPLELPPRVETVSKFLIVLALWLQAALWGSTAVRFALDRHEKRSTASGDLALRGSIGIVMFVANLAIFGLASLLALDNLGVNITALVAGLGVGGIAIALAVQTILGDLFASLSITFDKPFTVGDALKIDDLEGTVERIGIKSTHLRSPSGEQIVISNADLLKSRLRNLGRMPEQRALFTFGVAYDTAPPLLERLKSLVEAAVQATEGTRFGYCVLKALGDSALVFEVCYFVPKPQGGRYLVAIDSVNRRIHAALAESGIAFANAARSLPLRPVERTGPAG